ncbi:hypothetical protein [Pantoea allii]|uniref:hypothetical protein n=1 Tax=Pantoea allii TaxID=574096 RepID=UPI003D7ADFF9
MSNLYELQIKKFIQESKCQASLSNGVNWEDLKWDNGMTFYKYSWKSRNIKQPLSEYMSDFIKAYLVKVGLNNINKCIAILRAFKILEVTMSNLSNSYKISNLNSRVLDKAMELAYNQYSLGKVNEIYFNIKHICNFLVRNEMIEDHILNWTYPLTESNSQNKTIAEEENGLNDKLPDPRVISFMGSLFKSKPQGLRDIYTSSIFALLLCAPSRINEIMELNEDCLVVLNDSEEIERPCLRFCSEKGFGFNMKWLPDCMFPVAKEAIHRIKEVSTNARAVCSIIEKGEKAFYKKINKSKFEIITNQDLYNLGFDIKKPKMNLENKAFLQEIKNNVISCSHFWNYLYRKNRSEKGGNKKASPSWRNKLMIVNKYQLNSLKNTDIFTVEKVKSSYFFAEFNITLTRNNPRMNIFNRNRFLNSFPGEIKFNSHQIRHLINTMAQRTTLSEVEIALWSGRKNIHHNDNYNHVSHDELADLSRELLNNINHSSSAKVEDPSNSNTQNDIKGKVSYLLKGVESLSSDQQKEIRKKITVLSSYLKQKLRGVVKNDKKVS